MNDTQFTSPKLNGTAATSTLDVAIAADSIAVGIFGLLINGCIVWIIYSNRVLRKKDYLCFIANRTTTDFLYCFCLVTIQPISILYSAPDSDLCVTAAFTEVILACATMYAEPFLACNRYIAIYYNDLYKKLYKKRNVYLMCFGVWVLGLCSTMPHVFARTLCRMPGMLCALCLRRDSLLVVIFSNFLFMFVGLGLVAFFNYHIYLSIRSHQKQTLTNSQQSRLQKDREMLHFIAVSALAPIVLETPVILGDWVRMYKAEWAPDWAMLVAMSVFNLTPVINAAITLRMVRPIKNKFTKILKRLCKNGHHASVTPISQISANMVRVIAVKNL